MEGLTEADGARAQALGVLAALITTMLNSRLRFWGSGSAGHAGAQANLTNIPAGPLSGADHRASAPRRPPASPMVPGSILGKRAGEKMPVVTGFLRDLDQKEF